jgi:hypothetical protein
MDAAALFGDLSLCCDRMKMERQEKNEQQHSGANKAPQIMRILHAGIKHGLNLNNAFFDVNGK